MAAIMAALYGLSAAVAADETGTRGDALEAAPVAVAALAAPAIAGRWSGTPHAIRNDASRCGPEGCNLVLDIVACGTGWCGIEVTRAKACGAEAMQLAVHSDPKRIGAFEGKLSLGQETQSYVIEATYEAAENGQPARLYLIGDTGPEFMMVRRSFPFHATLARVGDAVCKSEKPVS